MTKLIKRIVLTLTVGAIALMMTACGSACQLGHPGADMINAAIDTSTGYTLKQTADLEFVVEKDGAEVSYGSTLSNELIEVSHLNLGYDGNQLIEESTYNGNEYFFYRSDTIIFGEVVDSEWIHIVKIPDSKRGIMLINYDSEDAADECFKKLTFTKK